MAQPTRSQVKINALNRLIKEHGLYGKELADLRAKADTASSDNGDKYELKQLRLIIDETARMLPQVRASIKTELAAVKEIKPEDDAASAASAVIADAEKLLEANP